MTDCDVDGDGGESKLCSNPCKNPDYIHYSTKTTLCYKTFAEANAGAVNDCNAFCGLNENILLVFYCDSANLCNNPCKNPDFRYYSSTEKLCYKTKMLANEAATVDCNTFCGLSKAELKFWGCAVDGDSGESKLCSNPCKNPDFVHYSTKANVCYKTFAEATAGAGACDSWCTNDLNKGTGCGDTRFKKCD